MTLAIGQDETPDPPHVRLLRAQAVMLQPQPLPHLVEQLRWLSIPRYTLAIIPVTHTPSPWADNCLRVSHPAICLNRPSHWIDVGFLRFATKDRKSVV